MMHLEDVCAIAIAQEAGDRARKQSRSREGDGHMGADSMTEDKELL